MNRLTATILLFVLPVAIILAIRNSSYGPALATPSFRQHGTSHAKVTVIEYSDFQCPSCARVQPQLNEWMKTYDGRVRLLFKHYPLRNIHPNAMPAAIAAECAGAQKEFWGYAGKLYETQSQWAPLSDATTHYLAIAADLKLDVNRFNVCRANPDTQASILRDEAEAKSRGINATPTFFVEDQQLVGNVFVTDGALAIERALRR